MKNSSEAYGNQIVLENHLVPVAFVFHFKQIIYIYTQISAHHHL